MYGISEIQRRNTTPFAKQPGAYAARAIEIAAEFGPIERNILKARGTLPPSVAEAAIRAGFDDYLLANHVRSILGYDE